MILKEFIPIIKDLENLLKFFNQNLPNVDLEYIEIYMKDEISAESELYFFDCDEIPEKIEIEINNQKYINLFPLYMLQDVVEEFLLELPKLNNEELVNKIINYRLYDA